MSRLFVLANTDHIDLNTTLGNWERTQAWSVSCWVNTASNNGGTVFGKEEGSGNFRGWHVFVRGGTTSPTFAAELSNVAASSRVACNTTTEFSNNQWRHVVWIYSGNSLVSGVTIWVDNSSQAISTIADTLSTNTITNSVESQIGCRGGVAAPNFPFDGLLRGLTIHNVALNSTEVGNLFAGTMVTRGLVGWYEFDTNRAGDGSTTVPDWSGNGYWGAVTGAAASTDDPVLTARDPVAALGLTGAGALSGPLTRNAGNPVLTNGSWGTGSTVHNGDAQSGPVMILRFGPRDYRMWWEGSGPGTTDPTYQTGPDGDTISAYATSPDGSVWTKYDANANGDPDTIISPYTITTNPSGQEVTLKTWAKGEFSPSQIIKDGAVWKLWFHGGNISGPRKIGYAESTSSDGLSGWVVQNSGNPVLSQGAASAWDEGGVADPRVIKRSATSYVMIYNGFNTAVTQARIGLATSSDGVAWTKSGSNPVLGYGAAGSLDAGGTYVGGFVWDEDLQLYLLWFGMTPTFSANTKGIGFAYSSDAVTWTRGTLNPVWVHQGGGATAYEADGSSTTIWGYLDGTRYRIQSKADNGVGGITSTSFRGRNEGYIDKVPQNVARPSADVSAGTWTNQAASGSNLYQSVDETTIDDTDYIQSAADPSADVVEMALSIPDPIDSAMLVLAYRARLDVAGRNVTLTTELRQGANALSTPASWTDTLSSATPATVRRALSAAMVDAISDFSALRLRHSATSVAASAPTLVGAGTASFTATNAATLTPGLPTGWAADDILILFAHRSDNTAGTTPTGWTAIASLTGNNTTAQRVETYWRRAVAGDSGPSFTFGSSTIVRGARIFAIRGCRTSGNPWEQASFLANAAAATISFTDVTTVKANQFILALGAYEDDPTTITTMTNYTQPAGAVQPSSLGNDMMLCYEYRTLATAGAAGATSVTVSGGTFANSPSVGVVLSFLPVETAARVTWAQLEAAPPPQDSPARQRSTAARRQQIQQLLAQ